MTVAAYARPGSLPEALALVAARGPELLVMAGGTVAMPLINDGISLPREVMSLRRAGLDRLEPAGDLLRIGATVSLTRLLADGGLPMLRDAASATGTWAVRNMATVGGNLFTPPPGGDVAVALLALDAGVELASTGGTRVVPLAGFYTGFLTSALGDTELVTGLRVLRPAGPTAYHKLGRRHANTPAVVTVAVALEWDGDRDGPAPQADGDRRVVRSVRIALGAVGPHPLRAYEAERTVTGTGLERAACADAAAAAARECDPASDGVASAWYRRRMVAHVVQRVLEGLASPTDQGNR